jgi:hypothetical protein
VLSKTPVSKAALKKKEGLHRFYGNRIETWELKFTFSAKK